MKVSRRRQNSDSGTGIGVARVLEAPGYEIGVTKVVGVKRADDGAGTAPWFVGIPTPWV